MALVTKERERTGPWYFDSGCSRHMTRTRDYLEDIKEIKGGKVTFGDGGRGDIQGKGKTSEIVPSPYECLSSSWFKGKSDKCKSVV